MIQRQSVTSGTVLASVREAGMTADCCRAFLKKR